MQIKRTRIEWLNITLKYRTLNGLNFQFYRRRKKKERKDFQSLEYQIQRSYLNFKYYKRQADAER